jgi:hypothetical protein
MGDPDVFIETIPANRCECLKHASECLHVVCSHCEFLGDVCRETLYVTEDMEMLHTFVKSWKPSSDTFEESLFYFAIRLDRLDRVDSMIWL